MTADGHQPALTRLPDTAACRILVLGDIMLDRYVLGSVRRVSPEAPIPVLFAEHRRSVLGGAANVARNVAGLGASATLIGLVGQDAGAAGYAELAARAGGIIDRSVASASRPTTVKTRFMAGTHQLLRLDEEDPAAATRTEEDQLLSVFEAELGQAALVVLSDYAKGVLTDRVLRSVIALARAAGIPVVADPKRADFAAYSGVTVLTPNLGEAMRATGIEGTADAEVERAARAAIAASGAEAVVVTRSEHGVTLAVRDGATLHLPTRARAIADVSGAGDTFIAALSVMLACGAAWAEAASVANVAAGLSVAKPGTATVELQELNAALHEGELLAVDEKVVPFQDALSRVAAWRAQGLRIGFTNGCFDLIHPGHVRLLQKARAACDRLVVGLNSDASVKRLKGPDRPIQSEVARATVMASMAAADLVVVFNEDTPERLIEAINPDLLFKGADYRIDQVVGGAFVQQQGGRVALIELEDGHSTTDTIRRIGHAAR